MGVGVGVLISHLFLLWDFVPEILSGIFFRVQLKLFGATVPIEAN